MSATSTTLRRTALHQAHLARKARMVPFGGFEMPVQYAGVLREHDAVRHRAGLFDLSHMGQFALRGETIADWADALTVNHVATMMPWQARYNIFCNDRGGAHDDVILYRLENDEWLLVVNASNAEKMWTHLKTHQRRNVSIENHHGASSLIAIQGPRSVEILAPLIDAADRERIVEMKYYTCARGTVAGIRLLIARTGYTGEDGFELFAEDAVAARLWDALLAAGEKDGLEPCGLGARDVLRLEAGMPLYGHELEENITPLQAGLAWAVKFEKSTFEGKAALEAQAMTDYPRIAGFILEGRAPARAGYRVFLEGRDDGEVRSGSPAPSVDNRNIGTALVDQPAARVGGKLEIDIRGARQPATVVQLPFYKRKKQ